MMSEAAELRVVKIATKRVKPRLRILLVYISQNPRDGGLDGISSDCSSFVQAYIVQPHVLYGRVAGVKRVQRRRLQSRIR
jgi:hypothetical protein